MSKQLLYLYIVCIILLFFSLFQNLGVQPLFQEEPRRAMIALEMQYNDNLIVPTEFGEFYYKKPPVWNWVLIGSFRIFGKANEFAIRFFTIISHILIGLCIIWLFKKHASLQRGLIGAFLYWLSIDIFYYFSMLGEIDIFYSMLTFLSFGFLYHFYSLKKYLSAFIIFYFLNGLGFLTKGFPSIAFAGVTIVTLFIINRDIKRLFSWQHILGGILFLLIISTYFFLYYIETQNDSFLSILWGRSAQRTILQDSSLYFLQHLYKFPYKTFIGLMPASLLLLIRISRENIATQFRQSLFKFMFWVFITNYTVYLLSPGSLQRYIYILYPVFCAFTAFIIVEVKNWRNQLLKIIYNAIPILFFIGTLILFIGNFFPELPNFRIIAGILSIAFLVISIINYRIQDVGLPILFMSFILFRILFNTSVLPLRNIDSEAQVNKENGIEISNIVKQEPLYIFDGDICSRNTAFYIERETKKVLPFSNKLEPGNYYILLSDRHYLQGDFEHMLTFNQGFSKNEFWLIKVVGEVLHAQLYTREYGND